MIRDDIWFLLLFLKLRNIDKRSGIDKFWGNDV